MYESIFCFSHSDELVVWTQNHHTVGPILLFYGLLPYRVGCHLYHINIVLHIQKKKCPLLMEDSIRRKQIYHIRRNLFLWSRSYNSVHTIQIELFAHLLHWTSATYSIFVVVAIRVVLNWLFLSSCMLDRSQVNSIQSERRDPISVSRITQLYEYKIQTGNKYPSSANTNKQQKKQKNNPNILKSEM